MPLSRRECDYGEYESKCYVSYGAEQLGRDKNESTANGKAAGRNRVEALKIGYCTIDANYNSSHWNKELSQRVVKAKRNCKQMLLKSATRNLPTLRFKSAKRNLKAMPNDKSQISFTLNQEASLLAYKFPEALLLENKKLKQRLVLERHKSIFKNKRLREFRNLIQFKVRQLC
eukprot:TRINITY_DN14032_c0_g1_i2.p1 TRINITY_DN14032_c0_g1~~TRINITY_DN14032_c0_g1_i2.p1  ORF type:complete len:173 (+),score=27.19 TRINITY_DN14032_c0_g1_i2:200-718(+)